ncbi:hypothetical protein HNR23_004954 [Nocardiopsis mwathae]|uniref:Asp23/Gls24 family envelope stress response protein n=1 Tax=Nocardiopsis mwathae TaxID=1472723 RepID=A0A7W9YMJ1_9ACTN|nr:hypothetical protein [Nocardiopsis mwathae]
MNPSRGSSEADASRPDGGAGSADASTGAEEGHRRERTAREIADRVRGLSDVADLSAGAFRTITTFTPGDRIEGVAVREDDVAIGVVLRCGRPIPEVAAEIRALVAPMAPGRRVDVSVEDVVADVPDRA